MKPQDYPNITLQAVTLTAKLKETQEFSENEIAKLQALRAELDAILPPKQKIMRVETIHR